MAPCILITMLSCIQDNGFKPLVLRMVAQTQTPSILTPLRSEHFELLLRLSVKVRLFVMRSRFHDIPDEELARRVRRGDGEAFEELVLRHQAAVRRWIRWIIRRPERVEDLAQEAFINAWRAREKFRGEASWRTWLMRIALRVGLEKKRRSEPITVSFTDECG